MDFRSPFQPKLFYSSTVLQPMGCPNQVPLQAGCHMVQSPGVPQHPPCCCGALGDLGVPLGLILAVKKLCCGCMCGCWQ